MGPEAWKRHIGEDAWNHLVHSGAIDTDPQDLAQILTAATEIGFLAPGAAPRVDARGTRLLWPGGAITVTAEGLRAYYASRGHGFFLLRMSALLRACAGVLMPRLQEILAAYEEQCTLEGVSPVAMDWRGFVGGTVDLGCQIIPQDLYDQCPTVENRKVKRVTIAGPDQQ
jgi:hypothetical protein